MGALTYVAERLALVADAVPYARCAAAYDGVTLEFLPGLEPGVTAAIDRLRRSYRLGLICNTLYTGGEVLRQALRCLGVHNAVQVLVFSDEVGMVKPEAAIFHDSLGALGVCPGEALHVGDSDELATLCDALLPIVGEDRLLLSPRVLHKILDAFVGSERRPRVAVRTTGATRPAYQLSSALLSRWISNQPSRSTGRSDLSWPQSCGATLRM